MNILGRIAAARARLPAVYWTVWVGTLINRLGQFVVPLITFYLTRDRGYTLTEAGVVVSAYGLGQIAASLAGGVLADRLGRRATLVISMFGGAGTMLVLAAVRSPEAITATMLALGFTGELYRPAVAALVADVVPPADRLYAYGLLYWVVNIGFAVAPALGGLLARVDFTILFIIDAATSLAYGILVLVRVPETRPPVVARVQGAPRAPGLVTALTDRGYVLLLLLVFALTTVPLQSMVALSGYMSGQGHDAAVYGAVLAVNGVVIVVAQPWITTLIERRDPSRVLALAAVITGVGFALHGLGSAVALHVGAVVVWTFGEILASPTTSTLVAGFAPPEARGRYQGLHVMAWGGAYFVAPVLGAAVATTGPHALWIGCAAVGAAVALGHLAAGPARRRRFGVTSPPSGSS